MSGRATLERVRFAAGQRLRADDLADAAGGELRRQALHVVGAHGTWGVALGLRLDAGPLGVGVGPGAAYDACGRVLRVERETTVLPSARLVAAGGPVVLVLGPPEDGVPGACPGGGALRIVRETDVRPGTEVPLAAFTLTDGALGAPDPSVRRAVRSLARARVGSGTATVTLGAGDAEAIVPVDTSAAGFVGEPAYVLTRLADDTPEADDAGAGEVLAWLEQPGPAGFALHLRVADGGAKEARELRFAWLGAEPPPGCPPMPRSLAEEPER